MAKKRKNKKLLNGLGIALVSIAATLGAIRLFGAPAEIVPDDQKILQCVGTIDFDTLEETTRYKRASGNQYGIDYTAECYEFTLGYGLKEKVEVRLFNASKILNDEDLNLSKQKVFKEPDDSSYYQSCIYVYDTEISFVEIKAYVVGEREIVSWSTPVVYSAAQDSLFGSDESKLSQKIGVASVKNYKYELDEIVSISFYKINDKDLNVETNEVEITNKVSINTSYSGTKAETFDDDSLLEFVNESEIFQSATINVEAETDVVSKEKGGIMLSGNSQVLLDIDTTEDEHEFNYIELTMKHADGIDGEDGKYASLAVNGKTAISYSNYLDTDKDYALTKFVFKFNEPITTVSLHNLAGYSVITSITLWNETIVESK